MKLHKLLIVLFAFSLVIGTKVTFAQDEEPWKNITEEEYLKQKGEKETTINDLKAQINTVDAEISSLQKDSKDKDAALAKTEAELKGYGDQAGYKKEIDDLDKIVMAKDKSGKTVEDAEKEYNKLYANPLRCLGDNNAKLAKIKKELDAWKNPPKPKEEGYTVVKGDCLWKIAKAKYNEPKAWFAIWEKNKEGVISAPPKVAKTIKNPNLIYPGQVLKVPALTDAEKKAAVDKANKYKNTWRKKMKVKKEEGTETKKEVKKDEKKEVKKDEKKDTKKTDTKKTEPKKDTKKEEPKKDTPKK
jgi:hypothetical protein